LPIYWEKFADLQYIKVYIPAKTVVRRASAVHIRLDYVQARKFLPVRRLNCKSIAAFTAPQIPDAGEDNPTRALDLRRAQCRSRKCRHKSPARFKKYFWI
jgi:hypothetical protein